MRLSISRVSLPFPKALWLYPHAPYGYGDDRRDHGRGHGRGGHHGHGVYDVSYQTWITLYLSLK